MLDQKLLPEMVEVAIGERTLAKATTSSHISSKKSPPPPKKIITITANKNTTYSVPTPPISPCSQVAYAIKKINRGEKGKNLSKFGVGMGEDRNL
jgi:hypothetical protein